MLAENYEDERDRASVIRATTGLRSLVTTPANEARGPIQPGTKILWRGLSNRRTIGTAALEADRLKGEELLAPPPARSLNSVAIGPGSTRHTLTPLRPSSRRKASVSAATAILVGA